MRKIALFLLPLLLAGPAAFTQSRLFLDQPEKLKVLEDKGFDFARLALGEEQKIISSKDLFAGTAFQSIAQSILAELEDAKKIDPTLAPSMRSSHRLFDVRWLNSPYAFFELVGIVNRLDRAPFQANTCGEYRFLYRLAYKKNGVYSRLPLTFNVVFWAPGNGRNCGGEAKKWESFAQAVEVNPAQVTPNALGDLQLKSVELNLQSVRWPSAVRPDMGGYAEYVLKVFVKKGEAFEPDTLENTPDVEKILAQPGLKEKLLSWLADPLNQRAIDEGIAKLPKEFLTKRAKSVALNGVHRVANAPFHRLFREEELKNFLFSGEIKTPHGFLRRLNDHTCMGCHQGRTVAGFHFLGKDKKETDAVNAIFVSASPHFLADQVRRELYQNKLLAGQAPEAARAISVRAPQEEGAMGAHCGLGDPSFAAWKCGAGLECQDVFRDAHLSRTGVCMPKAPQAGSVCEPGKIKPNANPHLDRVTLGSNACRDSQHCEVTRVGFPGGMCSGGCENLQPGETCGSIAVLQGFNDCLSTGRTPFPQCLRENVRPGALRECSEKSPCRDDYICTRTSSDKGACIPPYFLFQLRLDGHLPPL